MQIDRLSHHPARRKAPAQMFAVLNEILHAFRNVRRGRCPHRPKGSYEFAEDFRKNGAFCRGDVGIAPYAKLEDFRDPLERIKKSPDELVGGRVVGLTARAVRDMKCARIG